MPLAQCRTLLHSGNSGDIKAGLSQAPKLHASLLISSPGRYFEAELDEIFAPGPSKRYFALDTYIDIQRWPEISAQRQKQKMLRIWIFWLLIAEKLERLFQWSHKNRVQISRYGDMVIFMLGPARPLLDCCSPRYWLVTGDSLIGSSLDNWCSPILTSTYYKHGHSIP